MKLLDIVNDIISISEIGDYFDREDVSVQSFWVGENAINFINKNKNKYHEDIYEAYCIDNDIAGTYTLKKFESLFINYFCEYFYSKRNVKKEDITAFKETLKKEKIQTFSVFRNIHGITLKNPSEPLILGHFQIYDFAAQKELLESKTNTDPKYIWYKDKPIYLIEWKAKARCFEKAVEIADEKFEKFELLLRYIIGNPTARFEVGILNYQGWRYHRAYIIRDDGNISNTSSSHGAYEPIPLDDPYFVKTDLGYDKVWTLASDRKTNKLEKRIVLAIEWIGQSLAEQSPQSAFLKAAISLEIIFTYNEKTIITPSILHQISESTALILGNNSTERVTIESEVKKLYSLRSAIVHSGTKKVSNTDYLKLLEFVRSVIIKLMTSDKLKDIPSIEKLYIYLKELKYSSNAI